MASKSIRSTDIIQLLLDKGLPFQGIMSFTAAETLFLSQKGFDDILLAYPTMDAHFVQKLAVEIKAGKQIVLMVDLVEHLDFLEKIGKTQNTQISICIDLDLSMDVPGLHFGVSRSSITSIEKLKDLLYNIKERKHLHLDGVMGYEAQIAGVIDDLKGQWAKNQTVRLLKKQSIPKLQRKRAEAVK